MELELKLLQFADYILSKDFDNALRLAQEIGLTQDLDMEEKHLVKDTINSFLIEPTQILARNQMEQILTALQKIVGETFVIITLFDIDRSDGMDAKEFKASRAYQYIKQDDPQFPSEQDKQSFIRTLAMAAIATRDRSLIQEMVTKVTELES